MDYKFSWQIFTPYDKIDKYVGTSNSRDLLKEEIKIIKCNT